MTVTQSAPAGPPPDSGEAPRPTVGSGPVPQAADRDAVRPVDVLPPVSPAAPTGPIDGLEELPPPPSAGSSATPGHRVRAAGRLRRAAGRLRRAVRVPAGASVPAGAAGPALAVVAVVLLELGLLVHGDGRALWSRTPLWAGFATLASLVGLAAVGATALPGRRRPGLDRSWAVAAGGLAGLAAFWLLVVLPSADTDRGFLLTAAPALLGAALWAAPGRTGRAGEEEHPVRR